MKRTRMSKVEEHVIDLFHKLNLNETFIFSSPAKDCLEYRLDERMTYISFKRRDKDSNLEESETYDDSEEPESDNDISEYDSEYELTMNDNVKVLLGPSGSGKTRTILEVLNESFGYYFTVHPSQNDFGSRDMNSCMKLSHQDPFHVENFISVLYFVRVTICNYLCLEMKLKPSEILFAQLHPIQCFGVDVFDALFYQVASEFMEDWPNIYNCFPIVAIDDIQMALVDFQENLSNFIYEPRPFFSPLVNCSKYLQKFPHFIIAGTGINFHFIGETLEGTVFKADSVFAVQILNELRPLTKENVSEYATFVLNSRKNEFEFLKSVEIGEIVSRIEQFELCHGRGRFVAFILDRYLETKDIDEAFDLFLDAIQNVDSSIYPVPCLKDHFDKKDQKLFSPTREETSLYETIRHGLVDAILRGNHDLSLSRNDAAVAVQYGVGFGKVCRKNLLYGVELSEMVVIDALRNIIPFQEVIQELSNKMFSYPEPRTAGFLLEYLVAFAFVANVSSIEDASKLRVSQDTVDQYLFRNESHFICYPDPKCGADMIYKCPETKIIYILQIQFRDLTTKQHSLQAYHTTDPQKFYCNRMTGEVLKECMDKRTLVLERLDDCVNRENYQIKRFLFVHGSLTETLHEMENVVCINQSNNEHFFDSMGKGVWEYLSRTKV